MSRCRARSPLLIGGGAVIALCIAMAVEFAPSIVWNASPSAPIGLYIVEKRPLEIGDFVLVEADGASVTLIHERSYLPANTPLLKRLAALPGAEICREGVKIFVEGAHVSDALGADSMGRKMPHWSGCFALQSDEFFLLNNHEKSLDGRYFGATKKAQIIGVARPIFVWGPGK